jgi:enoyl-CoA hydratase/carnithine racemase
VAEYERIKVTRHGVVETIALSYAQRGNAIGPRMIGELLHALERARAAEDVRAIVLTGEGKAFCVGGDFSQMSGGSSDTLAGSGASLGDFGDLLLALAKSDKPVVARVNGNAFGGGVGLVAASTFAVASAEAKLGTPEVEVGLFPMIIMAMLARVMPRRRLLEMMLFGQKLDADEAVRVGLLNRAVPPDQLDAEVGSIVDTIATKSPTALRLGLRAFAAQDDLEIERALPLLRDRLAECLGTDDAREGLTAFLEKRAPRWTGK